MSRKSLQQLVAPVLLVSVLTLVAAPAALAGDLSGPPRDGFVRAATARLVQPLVQVLTQVMEALGVRFEAPARDAGARGADGEGEARSKGGSHYDPIG